jgi:hypothetical protein
MQISASMKQSSGNEPESTFADPFFAPRSSGEPAASHTTGRAAVPIP